VALCCMWDGEDRMKHLEVVDLLERMDKLLALLDAAYPFVAGHNWKDCDCIRCDWIRAYNHLIGSVDESRPSPHIDNMPTPDGAYDWATDDPDWDGG